MTQIKKITIIIYVVNFIFILGAMFAREFIIHAIEHNMAINIVISTLFIASLIFSIYSASAINYRYKIWSRISNEKEDIVNNPKIVNRIFGEKFSQLINTEGNKNDELLQAWTEHTDWKARILDYLSGTLIGLGLLGTFIGLMHTMGSISDVLGAASGNDMVKAIAVPLSSMSSAFSASLMGLLSSLSVGLLGMLVDRLNSEFVENIKSWIYNRTNEQSDAIDHYVFDGLQVHHMDTSSHISIKNSLAKIDAFCHQAEHFLSDIDNRIEMFKSEVALAFDAITHEVIKVNAVTESINRCTDVITESNNQLRREILTSREELMALNQLSISLSEEVKNEILLNRKDITDLNKNADLAASEIKKEVLSNRNEILHLNKLSVMFTQQFERHKGELTARMLNVLNCSYDNGETINEIKDKVDNLNESGRYSKKNIDRILTLQAICHDAGLVSLDEIVKVRSLLDAASSNEKVRDASKYGYEEGQAVR